MALLVDSAGMAVDTSIKQQYIKYKKIFSRIRF
jgi:hypothetical protein